MMPLQVRCRRPTRLAMVGLMVAMNLSACQRQDQPSPAAEAQQKPSIAVQPTPPASVNTQAAQQSLLRPIVSQRIVTQANCSKDCSQATATLLAFKAPDDWLNLMLDQAMLELADTNMSEQASTLKTLDARMQAFVKPDPELADLHVAPYEMQIAAELVDQWRGLLVIGLNGYYFTGGAHGSAVQRYLTIDRQARRVLTLSDLVLPNQQASFKQQVQPLFYQVFTTWVRDNDPSVDMKAYEELWPFHLSEQWRLTSEGLAMVYGQYDIGPYVVGMPELVVPYAALKGLLKPEYLPRVNA
jgi:hypothetical protein